MGWLKKLLLNIGLGFVIRALKKWGSSIKWEQVSVDLAERVKKLLPGEFWDDEAALIVKQVVAVCEKVLVGEVVEHVVKLAAEGKVGEALVYLKQKIVEAIMPQAPSLAECSEEELDSHVLESLKSAVA